MSRVRIAVLVSGGGTTLSNFVRRIEDRSLDAEVVLVIASKPGVRAIERARDHGLPCAVIPWRGPERASEFSDEITARVEKAGADLVIMGGFLRKWIFPPRWNGRVMNIHPALLPHFGGRGMYGHHVHEAVIAGGAAKSGCTVHFADHEYDQGPVILRREVPVLPGDTPDALAARVFEAECEAYPEAVALFGAGRLRLEDGVVRVLPPS